MLNQPLPRRRLLKVFAGTAAITATLHMSGCSFVGLKPKVFNTHYGRLLVLDDARAFVLFSFAEVCVANNSHETTNANVIKRLDEELYFVADDIRDDFLLALDVLEYLPMVYGYFSRFSRMSLLDREALLIDLQQTRIDSVSAVISACRMAVMMMFYGHESTWVAINYDGPFSKIPQKISAQRNLYQALTKLDVVVRSESNSGEER